jgi:hypothetical protein
MTPIDHKVRAKRKKSRDLMATADLEMVGRPRPVQVRLLVPAYDRHKSAWCCRLEIDAPFSVAQDVFGESSLQALALSLKVLASHLYGSPLYQQKKLGAFGEFGGYLGIPAPKEFLRKAPFPF